MAEWIRIMSPLWAPACDIENFSLRLRKKFEDTIERARIGVRDLEEDNIPTDEWDQHENSPEPSAGSLHDHWAELQKALDEDWLSSTGHSVRLLPLKIPTLYSKCVQFRKIKLVTLSLLSQAF
jgi:hypothetical protein